ncbi:MAG TPA: GIY-YIG nuclease family protein [Chthoniobacteraceae bacterium]|jgi:putative endonuclease
MNHDYFLYLLRSKGGTALYIGVTNDLERRLWDHRNPEAASFTAKYHCVNLVYYEHFADVNAALAREKQLKGWTRKKKNALVERVNPRWHDLSSELFGGDP